MGWSLKIGSIKGIAIRVHATFILIIIWGAFIYGSGDGPVGWLYGAFLTILLFGIVLLHELGHSLAALGYGIQVQDITLLPIGGVARLAHMPRQPIREFVVAAAGPAVNLVLAGPFFALALGLNGGDWLSVLFGLSGQEPGPAAIADFLFTVNLSLFLFNLIPAFPLDGGRIFRALLAMLVGPLWATRLAVWAGWGLAALMGLAGLFLNNWFTVFIAVFIITAGMSENQAMTARSVLDQATVREALTGGGQALSPDLTVLEVASQVLHSPHNYYPVLLNNVLAGVVHRADIYRALEKGNPHTCVADIMRRDVPRLEADMLLSEAQDHLAQANSPVAAVYEDGQQLGLIGFEDMERAFRVIKAQKRMA